MRCKKHVTSQLSHYYVFSVVFANTLCTYYWPSQVLRTRSGFGLPVSLFALVATLILLSAINHSFLGVHSYYILIHYFYCLLRYLASFLLKTRITLISQQCLYFHAGIYFDVHFCVLGIYFLTDYDGFTITLCILIINHNILYVIAYCLSTSRHRFRLKAAMCSLVICRLCSYFYIPCCVTHKLFFHIIGCSWSSHTLYRVFQQNLLLKSPFREIKEPGNFSFNRAYS